VTDRLRYALVTPARNEAENLSRLARCLEAQTALPACWVIVDNGSNDETLTIAAELVRALPWARLATIPGAKGLDRGGPIVRAFHAGVARLGELPDVIVKLDADVSLEPDYFERLLAAFAADSSLGIASGSGYEREGGKWRRRQMSRGSAWGAARAYRRACLLDVLPLEERMGWDGIDALKASLHGWTTQALPELPFRHHRREGERDGARARAWAAQGRASHYMGYRGWYLALRALSYIRQEPVAVAMIWGYLAAAVTRERRCPDPAVRARLRSEQRLGAIPLRIRDALSRAS
jgi:glycosyltransferase involved in cell wall biosynthesis